MFQPKKGDMYRKQRGFEAILEEPQYIIGVELEGVNHKITIYDGDKAIDSIKAFCKEQSKYC